jgi:hypothetical protein
MRWLSLTLLILILCAGGKPALAHPCHEVATKQAEQQAGVIQVASVAATLGCDTADRDCAAACQAHCAVGFALPATFDAQPALHGTVFAAGDMKPLPCRQPEAPADPPRPSA